MPIATIAAVVTLFAQQAPPTKPYVEGQEVRICGHVKTIRASPPACDATLRVMSDAEEFDVVIPIAVAKELSIRPQLLHGAQACFSGRVGAASAIPRIDVARAGDVEVLSATVDPGFAADAVIPCGSSVTMPRVIKEQKPQYTREAMRARVQGRVEMQVVVNPDGTVTLARVVESLHPELDEQALLAVKQWRFDPATKDGRPVPVLVSIEMTFRLRSDK